MLYKKNNTPSLNKELFKNPTAEYRGTPFWAWNCKLEQKELDRQLEILKKMGFGGAHMHVRVGLDTEYLGDEFMGHIKACVEKAKNEEMLAWLYDEDRWPSGAAGGLVTKDERFRARYLLFTPTPYGSGMGNANLGDGSTARADRSENGRLLACYDIELDNDGFLVDWKVINEGDEALHEKWYAYLETNRESPWYNNQTYVNTLDKAAIDRFIEITYEKYNNTIADEFDRCVPAIFTDEPQFVHKTALYNAVEKNDVILPWTDDLPESFASAYGGEDVLGGIPELVWERADKKASVLRYHYHDHVCERFAYAFADNCGSWCKEHGLELTGHMMEEPTLFSQTAALGEAMRSYRSFGLPGIDMLCGCFEYMTAKQAQSAVHQFGREGMLSELYGSTNWDFDFRGHKLHGDWQAALGVTIRVPHLSWVSMAGEAKRDFPAPINYQSPWWDRYSLVEDHFARLNTALTRGKPIVKVGVIHPVESYWLHWGPAVQTAAIRQRLDSNFSNITKWLLFGGIDFDFICESLLPDLCNSGTAPLAVGAMKYDAIIVPGCETLRSTTLERLEGFVSSGGKLIFAGELPTLEDARPSTKGLTLAAKSHCVPFEREAILNSVKSCRLIEIKGQDGILTDNLLYQMRQDGQGRWLFVAHGTEAKNKDAAEYQDVTIRLCGGWKATLYNTMNGETEDIAQYTDTKSTEIYCRMYEYDSLLMYLDPVNTVQETKNRQKFPEENSTTGQELDLPSSVAYTLSEPNVLLLDQAEYSLDDGEWQPIEEILRLDDICRTKLGWPSRKCNVAQPWAITEHPITHSVQIRLHIQSDIKYSGAFLAIEDAQKLHIKWNGADIDNTPVGWYVDKAIKTVPLPDIHIGENILEVRLPFGERTNIEWSYILGDFGVAVSGSKARIIPKQNKLAFGDIANQGLPFYGGNITYHIPIKTNGGELSIHSGKYRGIMQSVSIDDRDEIPIIYPPYKVGLGSVPAGEHAVDITMCGHRRNSFGPVHLTDLNDRWVAPTAWRTEGERWSYDYTLCENGIIEAPVITEKKN